MVFSHTLRHADKAIRTVRGPLECALEGKALLNNPQFNKGSGFPSDERDKFNLRGLLPSKICSLDTQVERAYTQYCDIDSPLMKNAFLLSMHDQNEVLFFKLISSHLKEMMPIIYTPTQGDAIASFSRLFRRPKGCFITYGDTNMEQMLSQFGDPEDIDYVVVTDGEAILGIGDQGVGGVLISNAKLFLMTLCAGIHPNRVLPVVLDVGTDNKSLLNDSLYLGLHCNRIRGDKYYEFVDRFIQAQQKVFPNAVLHFEDFAFRTARALLDEYSDKITCFNDDIQGTGAVTLAALMSASSVQGRKISEQRIVVYGHGSAGLGIADQVRDAMVMEGLSKEEAVSRFWMLGSRGLDLKSWTDVLTSHQLDYARPDEEWGNPGKKKITLLEVIQKVKPTIIIGSSAQPNSITEECCREMIKHCDRPIIFPLSNPSNLCEALPSDITKWTEGKALIATGSPFENTRYNGKEYVVAQCNNA